jgi:hypothetical protein
MSFLDHIAACNSHDLAKFRPLVVGGVDLGWVRHDVAGWLADFPGIFAVAPDCVRLLPTAPAERSAALDAVCGVLHHRHGTPRLKGERFAALRQWGDEAAFTVDRAVISLFGLRSHGVHVNGFVRSSDGLKLWIGKRADDKSVAPGKLDNMIAGGQPAHLSLMDNLVKEAAEEADVAEALARTARPVGMVSYCLEDQWGLKPDVMFCFDLDLPETFSPRNTDGEIQNFQLMAVTEVAALVRDGDAFKYNVPLVIIDFLIRHGRLDPDGEPDYVAIVEGLRRGR